MQSLSVDNDGILYIFKCLLLYNGGALYMLLYAAIIIYILIKGSKEMKRMFLYPSLILFLTVFNPFIPVIVNRLFDINKEYYRFIWIVPVGILLPAAAAYFITRGKHSSGWKIPVFLGLVLIYAGMGVSVYKGGYLPKENIYKIPNEVIAVSRMIRKNTDMKFPVAICDRDMQMEIRQYDATILMACDRTQYLNFLGDAFEDAQMEEKNEYVNRLLTVVGKAEKIDEDSFLEALDKTNTQFVVVPKTSPVLRFLSDAGLEAVGTTGTRVVYKYDLKEPIYYELADYSGF